MVSGVVAGLMGVGQARRCEGDQAPSSPTPIATSPSCSWHARSEARGSQGSAERCDGAGQDGRGALLPPAPTSRLMTSTKASPAKTRRGRIDMRRWRHLLGSFCVHRSVWRPCAPPWAVGLTFQSWLPGGMLASLWDGACKQTSKDLQWIEDAPRRREAEERARYLAVSRPLARDLGDARNMVALRRAPRAKPRSRTPKSLRRGRPPGAMLGAGSARGGGSGWRGR